MMGFVSKMMITGQDHGSCLAMSFFERQTMFNFWTIFAVRLRSIFPGSFEAAFFPFLRCWLWVYLWVYLWAGTAGDRR